MSQPDTAVSDSRFIHECSLVAHVAAGSAIVKYEGRSINKLQNGAIPLILKI